MVTNFELYKVNRRRPANTTEEEVMSTGFLHNLDDIKEMLECPQTNQNLGFYAHVLIEVFVGLWFASWVAELILSRYWTPFRRANVATRYEIFFFFSKALK